MKRKRGEEKSWKHLVLNHSLEILDNGSVWFKMLAARASESS